MLVLDGTTLTRDATLKKTFLQAQALRYDLDKHVITTLVSFWFSNHVVHRMSVLTSVMLQ